MESVTAQPRRYCGNADSSEHCCRTGQESAERSDDDDSCIHDNGCLMYEFFPNDPSRIAKRVADKLGTTDSRTAEPLGGLKVPAIYTTL
eukprot:1066683-Pyramimonas_sp.AAC.1